MDEQREPWIYTAYWIYTLTIFQTVPDIKQTVATIISQVGGLQSPEDEITMFDKARRLTADGSTRTHGGGSMPLTATLHGTLAQGFANRAPELSGLLFWWVVDETTKTPERDGLLKFTNTLATLEQPWGWQDCLNYAKVTEIQEALE